MQMVNKKEERVQQGIRTRGQSGKKRAGKRKLTFSDEFERETSRFFSLPLLQAVHSTFCNFYEKNRACFPRTFCRGSLTEHFVILEPQNQSIKEFCEVQIHQSMDFKVDEIVK